VVALQAVAAGSVQTAATAVLMVPDGATIQLQIVRHAQGPSIQAQLPQLAVDLRHLRHQHHQRRRHLRQQVQWSRDTAP